MKEDNKVATYGHHFHQYAEMIGAPNVHSVFEYLLDCYMSNIRTGKDGEFKISVSNIALRRVITRDTVRASINALLKMKLISIDGKKCTVNADMYVSLIYCYIGLEAEEEKKKFRNALGEGDYIVLEELGLQVLCDCKDVLLEQKGNLTNIRQFESEMTNISQFDEGQNVKLTNIRQLEGSDEKVANIRQNSIELTNIRQFDFENCLKFVSLASINFDFLKKQIEACVENGLKKFILTNIRQFMPELEEDPMFLSSLDAFCDGSFNIIDPWVAIFRHLTDEYSSLCPKKLTNIRHSNNIYNNNKKNMLDERSESSNKEEKSEETNLEDKDCKVLTFSSREGFKEGLGEDNDNDDSQLKEENIEEVEEEVKEEVEEKFDPAKRAILDNINVAHLEKAERSRIKSRTPFFPVNEIEDIIRNVESCLERPDKLFINRFWDIVFESEIEVDEDFEDEKEDRGKDILEDMEGWQLDCYSDITARYLKQAYDEVQEAFDKGYIETEDRKLPVNFKEMLDPESVEIILGFEIYRNAGRAYYIISAKMIRDISRLLPPAVDTSKLDRTERVKKSRNDVLYLQKIIFMALDDAEYEKLTPVEKEVYLFMDKFFIIDFDAINWEPNSGEQAITSVNSSSILPGDLRIFMSKMSCCTESEFIGLAAWGKDDKGNYSISSKRVFYADKIRELNALRGFESVVDSLEVDLQLAR